MFSSSEGGNKREDDDFNRAVKPGSNTARYNIQNEGRIRIFDCWKTWSFIFRLMVNP